MKLHFAETDQPKKMRGLQSTHPKTCFIENRNKCHHRTARAILRNKIIWWEFLPPKVIKTLVVAGDMTKRKERSFFISGYRKRFLNSQSRFSSFLSLLQMSRSQRTRMMGRRSASRLPHSILRPNDLRGWARYVGHHRDISKDTRSMVLKKHV